MTNMPEAKLAREAELCYATVAMVTDFDCWHPDHDHVQVADVVTVLHRERRHTRASWSPHVVPRLGAIAAPCPHGCDRALDTRDPDRARGARSRAVREARRGRRSRARAPRMKVDGRWRRAIELADDARVGDRARPDARCRTRSRGCALADARATPRARSATCTCAARR